jgi:hypothetical protein
MPRSSKWSLPLRLSNQNFVCISHLPYVCHMPCSSHPLWSDYPNNTVFHTSGLKNIKCIHSKTLDYFPNKKSEMMCLVLKDSISNTILQFPVSLFLCQHSTSVCHVVPPRWLTEFSYPHSPTSSFPCDLCMHLSLCIILTLLVSFHDAISSFQLLYYEKTFSYQQPFNYLLYHRTMSVSSVTVISFKGFLEQYTNF